MRSIGLLLLLAACAPAAPMQPAPEGAQWISAEAMNMPYARSYLDNKVAAACPNGHEVLDERSSIGWMVTASKLVRCR